MSSPNEMAYLTFDEAVQMYKESAKILSCCDSVGDDCVVNIACIRSKAVADILNATFGSNFSLQFAQSGRYFTMDQIFAPVIDGINLQDNSYSNILNGKVQDIPILNEKALTL